MRILFMASAVVLACSVPSVAASVKVMPGDSLWNIAQREYGDGARWPELCELNKSVLADCDMLTAGIELQTNSATQVPPDDIAQTETAQGQQSFKIQASAGPNLISDGNLTSANWKGYWVKPEVQGSIDDPNSGTSGFRLLPADKVDAPGFNMSGVILAGNAVPGPYNISFWARSTSSQMDLIAGVSDEATQSVRLTDELQLFDIEVVVSEPSSRIVQIYEATANNPAWEIYDLRVVPVNQE